MGRREGYMIFRTELALRETQIASSRIWTPPIDSISSWRWMLNQIRLNVIMNSKHFLRPLLNYFILIYFILFISLDHKEVGLKQETAFQQ